MTDIATASSRKVLRLRSERAGLRHVPLRHTFRPHSCSRGNNDKTKHVLARSDPAELAGFVILQGSCASFAEAEPCQDAGRILEKKNSSSNPLVSSCFFSWFFLGLEMVRGPCWPLDPAACVPCLYRIRRKARKLPASDGMECALRRELPCFFLGCDGGVLGLGTLEPCVCEVPPPINDFLQAKCASETWCLAAPGRGGHQ